MGTEMVAVQCVVYGKEVTISGRHTVFPFFPSSIPLTNSGITVIY